MNANRDFEIAFLKDPSGCWNMDNNVRAYWSNCKWVRNTRFLARLKFVGWQSTRSSAVLIFRALDGPFQGDHLCMSLHHFAKVFPTQTITDGVIEGDWTFYKRGSAFSLGPA